MIGDPVVLNDWHPVAAPARMRPGELIPVCLLGRELVLWRSPEGELHAWEDRCPHRGTRLSIGSIVNGEVVCRYHGWHFDSAGQCTRIPAHPDEAPPARARATTHPVRERYGLLWACVGDPVVDVLPFPEYEDPHLRKVLCGPYEVLTSGPRIVENFLDMAHFPFVHGGILGEAPHTRVREYQVDAYDDGRGGKGIQATDCFFWQPQTNSLAHGGSEVEYAYRVVRPLTAILTKVPQAQAGFREAISLHVQPLEEERSLVWIILALTNFQQSEDELRAFQDRIFLQDKPVIENQMPKRLPLDPRAEMPVRCDRMSSAYRRYLADLGMHCGVLPARS